MHVAHDLALMACGTCKRNANETHVDFSTRLYVTYTECYNNVQSIMNNEAIKQTENGLKMVNDLSF